MKKILLCSLGSRGDMEPFLALGQQLKKQGNAIAFCMPAQMETLAKEVSPQFFPQSAAFLDLVNSPSVRAIIGQVGSGWSRIKTILGLISKTRPIQEQLILDQEAAVLAFEPDKIIFHIKCIYPLLWGIQGKGEVCLLSPIPCMVHSVTHEPHIGFGKPRAAWWNRMTYRWATFALVHQSILGYGKKFIKAKKMKLDAKRIHTFMQERLEVQYSISEQLFPKPNYWPSQAKITGFLQRDNSGQFQPSEALMTFLGQHPAPLYMSFGSMVNAQPKQVGSDLLAVCEQLRQPIIINTSWGGIELPKLLPKWVFVVEEIPYDFLFQHIKAVIHHGGSGTVHNAFEAGKPQLIIPHIADQFFWSRTLVRIGAAVEGFPIKKWSQVRLKTALEALLEKTASL